VVELAKKEAKAILRKTMVAAEWGKKLCDFPFILAW
jgi:hypothetical protein